jgi:hypothetical protein
MNKEDNKTTPQGFFELLKIDYKKAEETIQKKSQKQRAEKK